MASYQQDNTLCHPKRGGSKLVSGLFFGLPFPRSQSNRASVGCGIDPQGPMSQLPGLKVSAAKILVPDITEHLQMSGGVHASMGQTVLVAKGGLAQF